MSEYEETSFHPEDTKTLKAYIIGFVASLLLTLLAFAIVGKHLLTPDWIYVVLMVLAVVQLLVQVIFFLRLSASKEGQWNLMPFLFTIFILLVIVFGSLWIMWNLNYNMTH